MANFSLYLPKQSFIHRLNPSLKVIVFLFLIVTVFLPTGLFGQIFLLFVVSGLWFMAKMPWRTFKPILKSVLVMLVILTVINWFSYKNPGLYVDYGQTKSMFNIHWNWNWYYDFGSSNSLLPSIKSSCHGFLLGGNVGSYQYINIIGDPDFNIGKIPHLGNYSNYTYFTIKENGEKVGYVVLWYKSTWYSLSSNALIYAIYVSFKISVIIMLMTILTSTTTSVQLSFAVEDILSPLRYVRLPVNEWSMTISIAIRFVPSLLQEAQRILNAQASRGVDFHNGKFNEKVKALISLVVPMFSIAFYKADDLANAMEARSYNPRCIRTRYRSYSIKWYDWLFLIFVTIFFAFFCFYTAKHFFFDALGWPEAILNYGV